MSIYIHVVDQKMHASSTMEGIVDGSQNFVKFRFHLSEEWNNLVTFAQFLQGGTAYNQYLDSENAVFLPPEIGAGTCTMMLYGTGGTTIATTNYLTLKINKNILVHDAESTEISQSLYNQLIDRVNAMASVDAELQRQLNAKANNEDLTLETNRAKQAEQANGQAIQSLTKRVENIENNEVIDSIIEEAVSAELNAFLESGQLANLAIQDGSLSRSKVDAVFEGVLQKADTAVQPADVQNLLNGLTVVVDVLPTQGQNPINYILKSASGYTYYKWIDGEWQPIGSAASGGDIYIGTADSGFYISSEGESPSGSQPAKPVAAIYGQNGDEPVIIRGVADPIGVGDAANKEYVDAKAQEILNQIGAGGASGVTSINGKTGAVTMPSLDFGTCASGAAVRDKAITGVDASLPLLDGTTLTVRFTTANTAASPRLTVNGQTFIVYDWRTGQPLTADSLGACTHHFVLYGGAWVLLNPVEAAGKDGKSAYDVAVENGFTGTVQEWLASLQGAPGQDGADGAPGRDGQDGADGGYYTPSVAADGMLSWSGSKEGMPPVAPIDLHDYIDTILPSGYCSTGAAVTDKIESFIDKAIANGSVVSVQFPRTNTASSPTLTVNGVKAPILDAGGQPVSPSALGVGRRLFLYSNASPAGWILLNPQTAALPAATAEDAGKAAIVGESGQYDLAYPQMPVVKSMDSNVVMQPNTFYRWGVMDRLTISFGEENPRIVNEFCGEFSSGTPATNFAVPASVNWVNALNIEPNKTYHFSIVNGIGVMMGV